MTFGLWEQERQIPFPFRERECECKIPFPIVGNGNASGKFHFKFPRTGMQLENSIHNFREQELEAGIPGNE